MHISQIANRFVKDPREVVKAGDIVMVKVLEVDSERKRISMTMRLDSKAGETSQAKRDTPANISRRKTGKTSPASSQKGQMGTLGQLLSEAQKNAR